MMFLTKYMFLIKAVTVIIHFHSNPFSSLTLTPFDKQIEMRKIHIFQKLK